MACCQETHQELPVLGLIGRQVVRDLIQTYLLALLALTAVLTLAGALVEAHKNGVSPLFVLMMLPYLIPPMLPYSMPTCLLFACTVVYSRLRAQAEITALKAGGITPWTALWPAVALSIVVAALASWIGDQVVPWSSQAARTMLLARMQDNIYTFLRTKGALVDPNFPYELYVSGVRDGRLLRPIFKHRRADGSYSVVAVAEEATLHLILNQEQVPARVEFRMIEGSVTRPGQQGAIMFRDHTEQMPIPDLLLKSERKLRDLTSAQCRAKADAMRDQAILLDYELASLGAFAGVTGNMLPLAKALPESAADASRLARQARLADVETHLRLLMSASAIPFVLLGCALSLLASRAEFLHNFFACFLPIVTIFYPMVILLVNVVKEGAAPDAAIVWLPFGLMALAAVPLLRQVVRY